MSINLILIYTAVFLFEEINMVIPISTVFHDIIY